MNGQPLEIELNSGKSRRSFLRDVARGAGAICIAPSLVAARAERHMSAAPHVSVAETVNESYWRQVKEEFSIKPNKVLLNAANLCPSPRIVRDTVFRLTEDVDGDVSFQNRAKFDSLREESRRKVAAFLGASEDEIAIVRNTSEGNNFVVNGLELKPGDEVLIFDQNHPTNNVAWDVRAARVGFTVKRVALKSPPDSVDEIVAAFRSAISSRTKALAFTDVSNTTGVRLPTKELCRVARERGVYTHVDGAQTFGALSVNVHDLGCDSYAASAHKWFMGPKEAGVLYVRQERVAQLWASVVGVGWGDKVQTATRGARKFETLGQRDDAAVSAMGVTVDFHDRIGRQRIESRIMELAAALKEGLSRIQGARLTTSIKPELSAGVCVIGFNGVDHRKLYEALYAQYGIAGAALGGIRLCPHIYNTMEEIDRVVSALGRLVRQ